MKLTIDLDTETTNYLLELASSDAVPYGTVLNVVLHLIHSAADGVRRPGSWEREWLRPAFGRFGAERGES